MIHVTLRTRIVVIWKHFCFIPSTGTRTQPDSVMRPRSSSRGRNTNASVTVTVTMLQNGQKIPL